MGWKSQEECDGTSDGKFKDNIKEERYMWTQQALTSAENQACLRMKGAEWNHIIRI